MPDDKRPGGNGRKPPRGPGDGTRKPAGSAGRPERSGFRPRAPEGDGPPRRLGKPAGSSAGQYRRDDDAPRKPFREKPFGEKPFRERGERTPRFEGPDGPPRGRVHRSATPRDEAPRRSFRDRDAGEGGSRPSRPERPDGPPRFARDAAKPRFARDDSKPRFARDESRPRPARDDAKPRFPRDETKPRFARDGADRPAFRDRAEGGDRPVRPRPARNDHGDAPPPRRVFRDSGDDKFVDRAPARREQDDFARRSFEPRFEERSEKRPERTGPDRGPKREARSAKPQARPASRPEPRPRPAAPAIAEGEGFAGERVAKTIARVGLGSRRDAEAWIEAGRVAINGEVLTSAARNVTGDDVVTVDGQPLPVRERTRLWLYHKPRGLLTTEKDPEGRPTVFENLPEGLPRVMSIGRLDINTEGLLLLTNDGGLARLLELPKTGWLRRYRARAFGETDQAQLDTLFKGLTIDDVDYGPVEARLDKEQGSNSWLTIGLREGKNREVKNILASIGLEVNRLIRVSFGPFQLGELAEGAVEEIKTRILVDQLGPLAVEAGCEFEAPAFERPVETPAAGGKTGPAGKSERRRGLRVKTEEGEAERVIRGGLIEDRRGRRVLVQRVADAGDDRPVRSGDGDRAPRRFEDRGDKPFRPKRFEGSAPSRDDGGSGKPRFARDDAKPRFARDEARPRPARDDAKPAFGDRPRTGDRPRFDERPRSGDKPRFSEKPSFGDKPKFGDKPRFAGKEDGRPSGARSFGDRPSGDRGPARGGKSFGGGKPFGDKPRFGGKPSGGRPSGGRPPRRDP